MSEELKRTADESRSAVRRNGFLGAIGVLRDTARSIYPTGHSLERAVDEVQSTDVTLGDVAEGVEADLDRVGAMRVEHDDFVVTRQI